MSSISKNNSFIDKLPHNHVTYPHNVLSSFMEKNPKDNPLFSQEYLPSNIQRIYSQLISGCTICLKQFTKPCKIRTCGHIFCQKCILKWIKISKRCPICREYFYNISNII